MNIEIHFAEQKHESYATEISMAIEQAAKARGTGIAKRPPEYIARKIREGKAVIALEAGNFAGFCYIETWGHAKYVANSGLIVVPDYRKSGLAKKIKAKAFELSRQKYPDAKIFGITTSLAVMRINSDLGYKPVTFSELTTDEAFWKGCQNCVNYDILSRTNRTHCLCTGMIYDPEKEKAKGEKIGQKKASKLQDRWQKFKDFLTKSSAKSTINGSTVKEKKAKEPKKVSSIFIKK